MRQTVLIIPGYHGSGPGHWQNWLEGELPEAHRVAGIDWDTPLLARWAGEVRREIDAAPGAVWLVAHSFGCLASAVAAADRPLGMIAPDQRAPLRGRSSALARLRHQTRRFLSLRRTTLPSTP